MASEQRVIITAEQASMRMGGESLVPLHYFRELRSAGVEAWLLVNQRSEAELIELFTGEERSRLVFCPDSRLQRALWSIGARLPHRIRMLLIEFPSSLLTQSMQQKMLEKVAQEARATVLHQPTPVSPMLPSLVYDVGVPVVIGPMNGGMQKPMAFQSRLQRAAAPLFSALKILLSPLHLLLPGKRRAAMRAGNARG